MILPGETEFLICVRQLREIGYGRMMQIIEREWYRTARKEGYPVEGVLVVDSGIGLLPPGKRAAWEAGYRADPLFRDK